MRLGQVRELYLMTAGTTGNLVIEPTGPIDNRLDAIKTFEATIEKQAGVKFLTPPGKLQLKMQDPADYLVTCEHGSLSHKGPWSCTFEEAQQVLDNLVVRDEALVQGSAIVDHGQPKYRLWRMCGRVSRGPKEVRFWQLVDSRWPEDAE